MIAAGSPGHHRVTRTETDHIEPRYLALLDISCGDAGVPIMGWRWDVSPGSNFFLVRRADSS